MDSADLLQFSDLKEESAPPLGQHEVKEDILVLVLEEDGLVLDVLSQLLEC